MLLNENSNELQVFLGRLNDSLRTFMTLLHPPNLRCCDRTSLPRSLTVFRQKDWGEVHKICYFNSCISPGVCTSDEVYERAE